MRTPPRSNHEIWGILLSVAGILHCGSSTPVAVPASALRTVDQAEQAGAAQAEVGPFALGVARHRDRRSAPYAGAASPAHADEPDASELEAVAIGSRVQRLSGPRAIAAGTLRGDWDTSSALLVVYNRHWQSAIQRLLAFAHDDLPVYVLATPKDARSRAFRRWARRVPFAGLVSMALDTPWIRDYGPIEVQANGQISWLDMIYAPEDRPRDNALPTLLSEVFETPQQAEPQLNLEGGGLISNGDGLCGMTEASLQDLGLPGAGQEQWASFLETIGCRTLARLPELPAEATGHADMLAQFLSPSQVAIAVPTASSPPDVTAALLGAREALAQAAEAHGRSLEFVELPLVNRDDLYYSYVNGLRTPSHYFVPSYSAVDPAVQALAHERLEQALHGVRVVGVDSDEMIENGGAIHCVTLGLKHPLLPRADRVSAGASGSGKWSVRLSRR
jgi:agmatine deiminase